MARLTTIEDARFLHAHKIFGCLVLGHFMWRMYLWQIHGNMGFVNGSWFDLFWMFAHTGLNLSSFEFHLQERKNHVYNIIWPEMRWHTLLFSYRSVLTWYLIWKGIDDWAYRVLIVFGTIMLADLVTLYYKPVGSTLRGNPYPDWVKPWAIKTHNYFYSMSQVLATIHILHAKTVDPVFALLIPIQIAPFGMTLVKKGLIRQGGWHMFYTPTLLYNFYIGWFRADDGYFTWDFYWIAVIYFCFMRFAFNANKYLLWGLIVASHAYGVLEFGATPRLCGLPFFMSC